MCGLVSPYSQRSAIGVKSVVRMTIVLTFGGIINGLLINGISSMCVNLINLRINIIVNILTKMIIRIFKSDKSFTS